MRLAKDERYSAFQHSENIFAFYFPIQNYSWHLIYKIELTQYVNRSYCKHVYHTSIDRFTIYNFVISEKIFFFFNK